VAVVDGSISHLIVFVVSRWWAYDGPRLCHFVSALQVVWCRMLSPWRTCAVAQDLYDSVTLVCDALAIIEHDTSCCQTVAIGPFLIHPQEPALFQQVTLQSG
jgi:hypothetical protein